MKRKTITKEVSVQGTGLHSGKESTMILFPASPGEGIKFRRLDMDGAEDILADLANVISTTRGTTLRKDKAFIHTIEHILAAVSGCEIDDIIIGITDEEVPIMDGSARDFVDIIEIAGIKESEKNLEVFSLNKMIHYLDEETGSEYYAFPSEFLEIMCMIDFPNTPLSSQYAELRTLTDFKSEVSGSRTFVLLSEIEDLWNKNMIKGGNIESAIVINDKNYKQVDVDRIAKTIGKDSFTISEKHDPSILRYSNEPARHKILDIIGDLALIGLPIHAKIIARKPGHKSNIEFAKVLKKAALEDRKLRGKPIYNPDTPPVFDLQKVKSYLPHRYPFLLVDKIIELTDTMVVGVKNVTYNEAFFQGHFPDNPIFPGVLQMEALAQTGGILALTIVDDPGDWDTYFLKMDNVKFKNKVVPGDTLLLKMELLSPIRRGIVHMQGTAYVGNKIVSEGELVAQIIKNR